jgi:ribosomal protein S18 acetylase RimI-like enzyme
MAFEEYRDKLFPPSGALFEEVTDIQNKIKSNGGAILVWNEDMPVGSAQYYFKEHFIYIGRVSVIQEARGYGIGKRIMQYLETTAVNTFTPEIRIEVRLSIPQNIVFYNKLGYEVLEQHKYPDSTDEWYIMRKMVQLSFDRTNEEELQWTVSDVE